MVSPMCDSSNVTCRLVNLIGQDFMFTMSISKHWSSLKYILHVDLQWVNDLHQTASSDKYTSIVFFFSC